MFFYFFIVGLSIIIMGLFELLYSIYNSIFLIKLGLIFSGLVPIMVAGLRVTTGTDYTVYSNYQIPLVLSGGDSHAQIVEPLYQLLIFLGIKLNNIFGPLGGIQYQWIFFLTSAVIVLFSFMGIYKLSRHYTLSVAIFFMSLFFFYSMNVMRDSISMSIFFFSISYILSKKWKRYIFWCVVSAGFHYSAVIFIFVYFIKYFRKVRLIGLLLPILSYIFSNTLSVIASKVMESFSSYSHYVGSDIFRYNARSDMMVTYFILIVFYFVFREGSKEQVIFFWFQCFASIVAFAGGAIPMAQRIEYYFFFILIFSIPQILNSSIKNRFYKAVLVAILVLVCSLYTYNSLSQGRGELLPYKNIRGQIF